MSAQAAETPHVRLPTEIQDLVAEGKLTLHAGWLYGLLLAHINYKRGDAHVWPSRSNLAKRLGLRKTQSVDRYLKELADAGLIEKETRKSEKRGNESNRYTLLLVSWPRKRADPSPLDGSTPGPLDGSPLVPQKGHELDEPQLDQWEPDQSTERNSTTSGRCAPSGGDVAQGDARNTEDELSNDGDEPTGSFWLNDRDAFRRIMGPRIVAEGSAGWPRGVYDTNRIYSELRVRKARRIDRPGSYVSDLLDKEDGRALENWLLREGFETPDGVLG